MNSEFVTQKKEIKKEERNWYLRRTAKVFLLFLIILAVVFVSAGRMTYWQGWVFAGISLALFIISAIIFINKIDLMKERAKPGPGTKWWDKVFYALYIPLHLIVIMLACLDAGRFRWSAELPLVSYMLSYVIYMAGAAITIWSMWSNHFFSSIVRIQTDRNHAVVEEGPYLYLRHPGYAGAILFVITTPLLLGSLLALIPVGIIIILFIGRTYLEDRVLQKELPGYAEYAKKVKYQLFPGIW